MTSAQRIPRDKAEMLDALRMHVRLLRDYSHRAFMDSNYDYLGEVAGKLRLLVYESRSNTPLLLKLMDEFGVEVPITMRGPPYMSGKQLSLREYLSDLAAAVRVESGELVEFSKMELIGNWVRK